MVANTAGVRHSGKWGHRIDWVGYLLGNDPELVGECAQRKLRGLPSLEPNNDPLFQGRTEESAAGTAIRPSPSSKCRIFCSQYDCRSRHSLVGRPNALRSHQALAYYRQLYELERASKDFSDAQRLQMRQDLAVTVQDQFRTWLEAQRPEVLPKSPIGEAIGYALNNGEALRRCYTEAGFLVIDNNPSVREMKRIAIGRKNWLTVGSPRGGRTAAVLFSFTSTSQRLGVEPWKYLQDALTRLPTTPAGQLGDLLPDHWRAAPTATDLTHARASAAGSASPSHADTSP
jgi:hypothetical protein